MAVFLSDAGDHYEMVVVDVNVDHILLATGNVDGAARVSLSFDDDRHFF